MLSDTIPLCCDTWAISHCTQKRWQRLMLWTQKSVTKESLPLIKKQPAAPGTPHKVKVLLDSIFGHVHTKTLLPCFCVTGLPASVSPWVKSRKLLCLNKLQNISDEGRNSSKQRRAVSHEFEVTDKHTAETRPLTWHARSHNTLHN